MWLTFVFANLTVCSQIWNLCCALGAALLVDKLGRRTLFIVSNAGMLISELEYHSFRTQTNSNAAFVMWTLTTALFQTQDNTDAAKGSYCPYPQTKLVLILALPSLATIGLIFAFYFFYDIAYTPMLVSYTLEILPFNMRAKGFAILVRNRTVFLGG